MTQINKVLQDLSSTISHSDYQKISDMKILCIVESPDSLIEKLNFYKEFLDKNNLSWDTAHLRYIASE
jgi:hypothetical protein